MGFCFVLSAGNQFPIYTLVGERNPGTPAFNLPFGTAPAPAPTADIEKEDQTLASCFYHAWHLPFHCDRYRLFWCAAGSGGVARPELHWEGDPGTHNSRVVLAEVADARESAERA